MYEYDVYMTRDGDRWDTLAYELYDDASMMPTLMADNPHLDTSVELEAGIEIYIRTNVDDSLNINQTTLPPWRT